MAKNAKLMTNIVGPPRPGVKAEWLERAVGKTIISFEYGEEENTPGAHTAESIILHFDDGTAMSIVVGSNASDLVGQTVKRASDVHTDLMTFWETK